PGNSGGPLFDQLGRVVGSNVMIASDKDRNQGIGFAIPSSTAKRIADHLIADGVVPRGYLGISMLELTADEAADLEIDGGVRVERVIRGEAADKAGIEKGDIIFRVHKQNLEAFKPVRHLRQIVTDLDPGTEITIDLIRGNERRTHTLTLGKRPAHLR
ncbi:MAG: PDZ domain-containing protein, partial [Planctomycetes bacterium]|nr:PDZ domain-containing protein [Planctomycetota bacterium]